jgi:hypothetical protein
MPMFSVDYRFRGRQSRVPVFGTSCRDLNDGSYVPCSTKTGDRGFREFVQSGPTMDSENPEHDASLKLLHD